jgi:aminocarboxymuconate-semialdehyde decarboxylase
MRINAHGHLLPEPKQIPQFMKEKAFFWIEDDKSCMCQGNWSRPITDASFFLDKKLEWMDKNNIDHEVILNLSQLYCNGMNRDDCRDVIRFQNDFNARVQSENPQKFTAGFVVQPLHLEDALKETERCVEVLDLRLMCLPTHYYNEQGKWATTADETLSPLYQLADHYGLALEFHPYDSERMIALENKYWRFHLIWMCAQTADCYHFYSLMDFPHRYPNIRACFAHGNQFGQMGYGRRKQGYEGRPDLFKDAHHPSETLEMKNVFFDSIVHDVLSFRLLKDRAGVSQIVAGLDDPYPLGEMESVPGCYPGKVIHEAIEHGFITENDSKAIWHDNVLSWLFAENKNKFYQRVKLNV